MHTTGVRWKKVRYWMVLTLLLSGCASLPAVPTWLGGKGEAKKSAAQPAASSEPVQVAEGPTGLRLVWQRSNGSARDWRVTGAPDKHFVQPGRIAVTDDG
ncbi:MAG: hypothetical protein HQM02_13875, partial [Magnetococcales bacterium]|nr:hypothetical protein [Magnetococcales bacterium]